MRIVSLSPSFTEIIQALGLGGNLAGITDYCENEKSPEAVRIGSPKALKIQEILNQFDFGAYICKSTQKGFKDAFRVTIFGKQKVLKWKSLIGSSNPYHLKRIDASVA